MRHWEEDDAGETDTSPPRWDLAWGWVARAAFQSAFLNRLVHGRGHWIRRVGPWATIQFAEHPAPRDAEGGEGAEVTAEDFAKGNYPAVTGRGLDPPRQREEGETSVEALEEGCVQRTRMSRGKKNRWEEPNSGAQWLEPNHERQAIPLQL